MKKQYETPKAEVIHLDNSSFLCLSDGELMFGSDGQPGVSDFNSGMIEEAGDF